MTDRQVDYRADIWGSHRLDLARDGDKIKFMIVQNRTNEMLASFDLPVRQAGTHISRLINLLGQIEDSSRDIAPDRRIS